MDEANDRGKISYVEKMGKNETTLCRTGGDILEREKGKKPTMKGKKF